MKDMRLVAAAALAAVSMGLAGAGERLPSFAAEPISQEILTSKLAALGAWQRENRLWDYMLQTKAQVPSPDDPRRDFRNINFSRVDLSNTDLAGADLRDSYFESNSLRNAYLARVDLRGTRFLDVDLRGAVLPGADVRNAYLFNVDLLGTQFRAARLEGTRIALKRDGSLEVKDWLGVQGLAAMKPLGPDAVTIFAALREGFKKTGARTEERALTAALKRHHVQGSGWLENALNYVAFDLTVDYGNQPARALLILCGGILIFTAPYTFALARWERRRFGDRAGIWRVWHAERIRGPRRGAAEERELLIVRLPLAISYGFYFSVLSAFHFGWRDLNVGNWITRVQPNEYALRPTGWVRAVSGLQSLLSVYLVALWALCYFGRPFE